MNREAFGAVAPRRPLRGRGMKLVAATDVPATPYAKEIRITLLCIGVTFIAWGAVTLETIQIFAERFHAGAIGASLEQVLFIVIIQALIYGNFVYQIARLGYLRRRLTHRASLPQEREALYDADAPSLAILVPSYKEEFPVVRRTLLSAALQDYPDRRVVLLLDDPPNPDNAVDRIALESMRCLPAELQSVMDAAAAPFARAVEAFRLRAAAGQISPKTEGATLAQLYLQAAASVESIGRRYPVSDHADQLFDNAVIKQLARSHRERAGELLSIGDAALSRKRIEREYRRLVSAFEVKFSSFERKRYVNLSHEPNKAMNLNSYIGLLGRNWQEVSRTDGLHLVPVVTGGSIEIPAAEYLITLDADSLLVPDYALVLIDIMLRPGNERLAVAQTPYNTIPNAPGLLEHIAGATTDIQYLMHQGFTHFDATYWVGANALLRVAALHDIRQVVGERGYEVSVFIQDRTVIEDTESSVDLVARGWKLYNYPERLAFSATPPDFGSLLIQRRRWANGGLIILPKLLRYLSARPHGPRKIAEGFFRIHYLASITAVNIGLLILLGHNFEKSIVSVWLPLTAVPYFFLYARDLRYSGYSMAVLLRVYALNLLLLPVNLGGVLKSLQQAVTGRRIPFGRTPKVNGRTSAPAFYVAAEYVLLASLLIGFGINIEAGYWISAIFCIVHALMLAYAIRSFIGVRESWQDLHVALPARRKPLEADTSSLALADAALPVMARAKVIMLPVRGAAHEGHSAHSSPNRTGVKDRRPKHVAGAAFNHATAHRVVSSSNRD